MIIDLKKKVFMFYHDVLCRNNNLVIELIAYHGKPISFTNKSCMMTTQNYLSQDAFWITWSKVINFYVIKAFIINNVLNLGE